MAYETLADLLAATCSMLRAQEQSTELINHQDIPSRIGSLNVRKSTWYATDVEGAVYNFIKGDDSYWVRTNQGVKSSASVCKVVFSMLKDMTVTFHCYNYAESNFDYGIIGKVDTELLTEYSSAEYNTDTVAKHFRGSQSATEQTYQMTLPAGEHFVYIKYIKDVSQDSNEDMFRFTITGPEEIDEADASSGAAEDLTEPLDSLESKVITLYETLQTKAAGSGTESEGSTGESYSCSIEIDAPGGMFDNVAIYSLGLDGNSEWMVANSPGSAGDSVIVESLPRFCVAVVTMNVSTWICTCSNMINLGSGNITVAGAAQTSGYQQFLMGPIDSSAVGKATLGTTEPY